MIHQMEAVVLGLDLAENLPKCLSITQRRIATNSASALAGHQGRQYYVVTLHSASPLDELEEAQAAVATSPADTGFQMPSGFKLKGAPHTDVTCPLAETLESEFTNLLACISIFYGAPLTLLHEVIPM